MEPALVSAGLLGPGCERAEDRRFLTALPNTIWLPRFTHHLINPMDQNVLATEIVEPFSRSLSFLGHGGEMGRAMREKDWLGSPLDEPGQWPQELKSTIALMLNSGHSMFLAWGPELTFFYNDAYIPLLGSKHPALGKPFQDVWHDIWPDIEPIVLDALAGKSTWLEDFRLLTERNGYPEEAFFTFSYSPVRNSQGEVCGLFCAVNETTGKVDAMNRRRAVEEELVQSQEQLRQSNEYLNTINCAAALHLCRASLNETSPRTPIFSPPPNSTLPRNLDPAINVILKQQSDVI